MTKILRFAQCNAQNVREIVPVYSEIAQKAAVERCFNCTLACKGRIKALSFRKIVVR